MRLNAMVVPSFETTLPHLCFLFRTAPYLLVERGAAKSTRSGEEIDVSLGRYRHRVDRPAGRRGRRFRRANRARRGPAGRALPRAPSRARASQDAETPDARSSQSERTR